MARILVLDDEDHMREAVRLALERDGHEISEVADGATALSLFRDHPTDIVITDLVMPHKDGAEVIRDLRKLSDRVKIVALSGRGGICIRANLDRALMTGADRALMKPCDFDELRRTIRELTGEQPMNVVSHA